MASFLKTLVYWFAAPFIAILGVNFFRNPPFHFWPGIFLVLLGGFWGLLSMAYMILDGHGMPFFGRASPKKLVTSGPYSMSRNPIYLGYTIYTLGLVLWLNPLAIWVWFALTVTILTIIVFEEKVLEKNFEGYRAYRKRTPLILPLKGWKVSVEREPPLLFVLLYLVGKFLILFLYDVRIAGKESIPDGPYVVVSNHNSYFDPFYVIDAIDSYLRIPVSWSHYGDTKWLLDRVGMFPIKRYTVDTPAIMKFNRTMRSGGVIGIFPENERSWDGRPLKVKNGIDRLLKMSPNPILPVRVENAHMAWPRWGKLFHTGVVKVTIGTPVEPEEYGKAIDFIMIDTVPQERTYKDYRGIEGYLWRCPKCGVVSSISSRKDGFKCSVCEMDWIKPSVREVRKLHDSAYPSSIADLPISDDSTVNGERTRITLTGSSISIGGTEIPKESIKAILVESRHEFYLYDGGLYRVIPENTSPLMWKEWFDFLKRDDPDYWSYL